MSQNLITKSRFSFRLMTLALATTGIVCVLGAWIIQRRSNKPDLSITAADVAWAAGVHITKIDLSDAGPIYGLQIVTIDSNGIKRRLLQSGGQQLIDTSALPVVRISLGHDRRAVYGKLAYGGGSTFRADNFLAELRFAWTTNPVRNGNLYYLGSDSKTVRVGKEPFEKDSNRIALELLTVPTP